jgi:hypothetical protein
MSRWKHVVVGDVAEGILRAAFQLDQQNATLGEVRNFRDDLSIGRIDRLMEGTDDRFAWFSRITAGTVFGEEIKDWLSPSLEEAYGKILTFDPRDRIVIWHSGIVSEQITLRYLVSRLAGHELWEVEVLPGATGACTPQELLEALKEIRRISNERQEQFRKSWEALQLSQSVVRIWENKRIRSVVETYYDQQLIDASSSVYQSAARVVGMVMGTTNQIVSDTFLNYRLRRLIRKGRLEAKGELTALRFYEVRKRVRPVL